MLLIIVISYDTWIWKRGRLRCVENVQKIIQFIMQCAALIFTTGEEMRSGRIETDQRKSVHTIHFKGGGLWMAVIPPPPTSAATACSVATAAAQTINRSAMTLRDRARTLTVFLNHSTPLHHDLSAIFSSLFYIV